MFKKISILTAGFLLSVSVFASDVQDLIQNAENGDVAVQANLADYYHNQQDYINEFYWTEKLANQGFATYQFNLGVMYNNGLGVHQDDAKAVEWYTKSASQNFVLTQFNLGNMYRNGRGVEKDDNKAIEWWSKSAQQDFEKAQYNLAGMYLRG